MAAVLATHHASGLRARTQQYSANVRMHWHDLVVIAISLMLALRQLVAHVKAHGMDEGAFQGLGAIFAIAGVLIIASVALTVAAAMLPIFISSGVNATKAVSGADFGNGSVNALRTPFVLLLGVGILLAAVSLIFAVITLRSK